MHKGSLSGPMKNMLWVLKRTVSMRSEMYLKTDRKENIDNFTHEKFVYLDLWTYIWSECKVHVLLQTLKSSTYIG